MGTTLHRVTTISMARCTLTLLKTMLTELLRGGSFEFKDMRVPSALVTLHMLLCSIPLSGRLDSDEQKIQNDIIDILLTFTQGVNEKLTISEETLANNTWSLMLKEVLSSILKVPEGFFLDSYSFQSCCLYHCPCKQLRLLSHMIYQWHSTPENCGACTFMFKQSCSKK